MDRNGREMSRRLIDRCGGDGSNHIRVERRRRDTRIPPIARMPRLAGSGTAVAPLGSAAADAVPLPPLRIELIQLWRALTRVAYQLPGKSAVVSVLNFQALSPPWKSPP